MIKPNEIRLGNWVNAPRDDQSPFRIDLIEHQSETYCKVGMNVHFYPNPLDENQIISAHPLTWESKDLEHIYNKLLYIRVVHKTFKILIAVRIFVRG